MKPYDASVFTLLPRVFLAVAMSVALMALTLPLRAMVPPETQARDCCAAMSKQDDGHHCKHEPVKPKDRPCCPACVNALVFLLSPAAPFIFSPDTGERLAAALLYEPSRVERPPVPPPRRFIS